MTAVGGVSYGYDQNGNQTSRASDAFVWDNENRMTSATIASATSTYAYDGDGVRASRTTGGNTSTYTWDLAAKLPLVIQDGSKTYVYGLGLVSVTDGAGARTYRLADGLGSTANVVDASGVVVVSCTYDVFGAVRSQTGSSDNVWLFTGEQRDTESGYIYLRARYHDPTLGRFISRDPASAREKWPETINRYVYVLNDPVNRTDSKGLCPDQQTCTYGMYGGIDIAADMAKGYAIAEAVAPRAGAAASALTAGIGLGLLFDAVAPDAGVDTVPDQPVVPLDSGLFDRSRTQQCRLALTGSGVVRARPGAVKDRGSIQLLENRYTPI